LKGFEALGAKIKIEGGYVDASAKKLTGATMFLGGAPVRRFWARRT
jgi:UDP-N-acetylglucosamine enolpyruvyl transferase